MSCQKLRDKSFDIQMLRQALTMSPKIHMFDRVYKWNVQDLGLNPRIGWCHADEDLVGNLVQVAEACHLSTMATFALTKWLLLAFD